MTEPTASEAELEPRLLHLLNVMVAYSGFARQDAALATAHEGLTLSRSAGPARRPASAGSTA
jgi:hypothetical protein